MRPLKNHLGVACRECGVGTGIPCAGDRTCTQRIFNAITSWFDDYDQWVMSVECPNKTCFGKKGQRCTDAGDIRKPRELFHGARTRVAEQWGKRTTNAKGST